MNSLSPKKEHRMYKWLLAKDKARSLTRLDPTSIEVVSIAALLFWGLVVFNGDWSGIETYLVMDRLLEQPTWGALALSGMALQSMAVALNCKPLRELSAGIASVFWFTLFGLTAISMFTAPAPWVYIVLGLSNSWAVALNSRHR